MNKGFDPDVVEKYERDTWSRCADDYIDTFAGITGETVPLLLEAAGIRQGSQVLEIGSGPGHVAAMLVQAGASVIGVDFSSKMVEVAKSKFPGITFQQADAEQLPFETASFDAVVANFVVHHLARPETVFREVNRVLRPGGRFAFAVWGAPEEQSSIGAFFGAVMAHHDLEELPHGPLFGVTERSVYEPMLTQAALKDCQLAIHEVTWKAESLDPILKAFWDWGDMAALPAETQEKIQETTRENAKPFEQNGRYAFPHSILFVSVMKA
ncbi:MAG: methyltransferase domain-containing protein [Gammaproteobacteria bacterium]|nr:methyltransferase domain-containing protein [Gammaproteobacteria bacterium]